MNLYNESSQIIINRRKGLLGEYIIKQTYLENGFKIIKTQRGCDFVVEKLIPGTSKIYREYVEVKTGHSRQTKIQKKTMKTAIELGNNYTVFHVSDSFLQVFLEGNKEVTLP